MDQPVYTLIETATEETWDRRHGVLGRCCLVLVYSLLFQKGPGTVH